MKKPSTMRRVGAAALTIALASALCVPAMAFADATTDKLDQETTTGSPTPAGSPGDVESEVTGTIKVTSLSVTVPTKAAFYIDPSKEAGTDPSVQITSPTNYTITNNSTVDIYAHISQCATSTGVTLVQKEASLSTVKSIMFAVKDDSLKPTSFATEADWLKTGMAQGETYLPIMGNGKIEKKPANGDAKTATMKFYGQTKMDGWADTDTFTITPTFTIGVTAPVVAP